MIGRLVRAGADAFRVNMSHGDHATHAETIAAIRAAGRRKLGRADRRAVRPARAEAARRHVQGRPRGDPPRQPLHAGPQSRTGRRNPRLPAAPELFGVLQKGQRLLIDDGKLRLRVIRADENAILCSPKWAA
jgi:pyruvate kinase